MNSHYSLLCLVLLCLLGRINAESSQFQGKVVLLTGGSTGIGYSTALKFAQAGAQVVFCNRNSTQGSISADNITSDSLVAANNGTAEYYQADVSDYKQVQKFVKYVVSKYGNIDIAVNNAGISGWAGNVTSIPSDIPFSTHDAVLNNFYGTMFCMQEEIRHWETVGASEGIIVNVASVAGLIPVPGNSMYDASKHAIIGLSKSVAQEFDKAPLRVRVNVVAPGFISTPMVWNLAKHAFFGEQSWEGPAVSEDSPLWQTFKLGLEKRLPGQAIGRPRDVANLILFLASEESSFISGSVMTVDNGDF